MWVGFAEPVLEFAEPILGFTEPVLGFAEPCTTKVRRTPRLGFAEPLADALRTFQLGLWDFCLSRTPAPPAPGPLPWFLGVESPSCRPP